MRTIWAGGLAGLALVGLSACDVPSYSVDQASGPSTPVPGDASVGDVATPPADAPPTSDAAPACTRNEECPTGRYCTSTGFCAAGCRDDSECVAADASAIGMRCDPDRHLCRGCEQDAECPAGTVCAPGNVCVPGCNETQPCAAGDTCCSGRCVDATTDLTNCGGCGIACPPPVHGAIACVASACTVTACDPGFANCDGLASNGCESELATDALNCGACGTTCTYAHATGACSAGKCELDTCEVGWDDCDADATNGCEVDLNTDLAHCGECANACPTTSGTPVCTTGVCKYTSCAPGFGDCDGTGACATTTTDDVANCGACGKVCTAPNGFPACVASACVVDGCSAGWEDCDTLVANGCETNLASDPSNCGACGEACDVDNATATCNAGACTIATCNPGYVDCDGNVTNGCERSLATAQNSCSSATSLVDSGGSTSVCGNDNTETTKTVTPNGTRFYKMRLARCDDCTSSDRMRLRATLVSPPGAAYDLRLYTSSSCSSPVATAASGVLGGTEVLTWVDSSCSSRDVWIEVRYRAGASCNAASLVVTGAY